MSDLKKCWACTLIATSPGTHIIIYFVCKNLNNKISLLKHILYNLTDEMKQMFYNAYLVPIFDYCCTVWGKSNKNYINKVKNNLQKRAATLILHKPVRTPTHGLFKQLKWLSFNDRCKYHTSILVYKTLNNMAPLYMTDIMGFLKMITIPLDLLNTMILF